MVLLSRVWRRETKTTVDQMKVLKTSMINTNKDTHKDSKIIDTHVSNLAKTISNKYIRDVLNDKKLKKTKKDKT